MGMVRCGDGALWGWCSALWGWCTVQCDQEWCTVQWGVHITLIPTSDRGIHMELVNNITLTLHDHYNPTKEVTLLPCKAQGARPWVPGCQGARPRVPGCQGAFASNSCRS